jgi:hypothetical protein
MDNVSILIRLAQQKETKTMNTKTKMAVTRHGKMLQAIFPKTAKMDPVELCKKLRRLENDGNRLALRLCNGPEFPGGYDEVDKITDRILYRLDSILGFRELGIPVFINRDPRGYALKIDSDMVKGFGLQIYQDWGGYGIIAPDLTV